MVTAVSNTIVSFIPVFALTDAEGKLFKPLAYTKTFAIASSIVLALTVVPVLCDLLLRPGRWSRRRAFLMGSVAGLLAALVTRLAVSWDLGLSGAWSGWPAAAGVGRPAAMFSPTRDHRYPAAVARAPTVFPSGEVCEK